MKTAVLITNLGSPKSTSLKHIREYLAEFLMDPDVISLPYFFRLALVRGIIVPFRSPKSRKAYQTIWTERGSPLLYHSTDLAKKLQQNLGNSYEVFLAMRYSEPSLSSQLKKIAAANYDRVLLLPLYPQYADATTGTTLKAVAKWVKQYGSDVDLNIKALSHFYWDTNFIDAVVEKGREALKDYKPDHILFSFHGLPEKALRNGLGKHHCYENTDCCLAISDKNVYCYRSQSMKTARHIAERLHLSPDSYTISFQSRLGRAEWIKPYTQDVALDLARRGHKRLLVFSPAFVADCLETLEEIAIALRQAFIAEGGSDLRLVPSLNASDTWVNGLCNLIQSEHFEDLNTLNKKLSLKDT